MGALRRSGRVLHGQGRCRGAELTDFLPTAPLLNQISFFKKKRSYSF